MASDIVFPAANEKEFIKMAELLGYGSLIFAYPRPTGLSSLQSSTQIRLISAVIGDRRAKQFPLITGSDPKLLRHILESVKPDFVFGLEFTDSRDSLHYRNSGLNQVLCNIAAKNNITFIIPLKHILQSQKKNVILGRVSQNIRLCRKYKVRIKLASFATSPYEMKSPKDLASLGMVLGMGTEQLKE